MADDELIETERDDDEEGAGLPSEKTEDGGVLVRPDGQPSTFDQNREHYENLAYMLPQQVRQEIGLDYLERAERYRKAREERDKQYAEGIRRTGLGEPAPGGADFAGANKVTHPMITQACVDFAARAIKELMPSGNGPVKDYVVGKQDKRKLDKARRKTEFMNLQMTRQAPFREVLHKMLLQLGMAGSQYTLIAWDERRKQFKPSFVPIDMTVLPPDVENWYDGDFKGYITPVTQAEFEARVRSGEYETNSVTVPSMSPDKTETKKASDKVEGVNRDPYNTDGTRAVYNFMVRTNEFAQYLLDDDDGAGDVDEHPALPYIIIVDEYSKEVIGFYRNWQPDDEKLEALDWIIDWTFIPWRGPYGAGFPHLIGGLSSAATGSLRVLLDSGHISTVPGGLKLKGSTKGGQSINIRPGEIQEVEGGLNVDDIRKLFMPFPFKEPSATLMNLLGFLVDAANATIRTTLDDTADSNQNTPVGTTLARFEQALVVYSAIMGGLHASFNKMLQVMHRINSIYLDDEMIIEELGELVVRRSDFEGPCDVIPVSDPNVYSDAQRMAHAQIVAQRSDQHPERYDGRAVEEYLLDKFKVQGADELLVKKPEPQFLNAVNENVAAVAGRPISAFPDQNHLAHIQTHVDFMKSQMLGMSSIMAPSFLPLILSHLKEHISFLYAQLVLSEAGRITRQDFSKLMPKQDDVAANREYDEALAMASELAIAALEKALAKVMPIIQQAQQMVAQLHQPGLPPDPTAAAMVQVQKERNQVTKEGNVLRLQTAQQQLQQRDQEAQRRATLDEARLQAEQQNRAQDRELEAMRMQTDAVEGRNQRQADLQDAAMKQEGEDRRTAAENATKIATNTQDNQTALMISEAEIEAGKKSNLSTGTGINPKGD